MCNEAQQKLMRDHIEQQHKYDSKVLDTLYGEVDDTLGEGVRRSADGMVHKIDTLYSQAKNGGMPSKLRTTDSLLLRATAALVIGHILGQTPLGHWIETLLGRVI